MNETNKSPNRKFIAAGVLFLISGVISLLLNGANLLSLIIAAFDGYAWTLISGISHLSSLTSSVLVGALGIILVMTRKNTKAVPIITGTMVGFGLIGFALQLLSWFFNYDAIGLNMYLLINIGNLCIRFIGFFATLLLFILAIFNYYGKQRICKLWWIPVVFKVLNVVTSSLYTIVYTFKNLFGEVDWSFLLRILLSSLLPSIGELLGVIAFGFLCFALGQAVSREPTEAEESHEAIEHEI